MSVDYTDRSGGFSEIPLRAKPPKSAVGLNKSAIITSILVGALVIGFVFLNSLTPKEVNRGKSQTVGNVTPDDKIRSLPDDYSQLFKEAEAKKKLEPVPAVSPIPLRTEDTDIAKIMREHRLNRIKQMLQARDSSPEFQEVKLGTSPYRGTRSEQRTGQDAPSGTSFKVSLGGESALNTRDDANRQDEKNMFLNENREDDYYLKNPLVPLISKYAIQAGTIIPGVLLTGINSDLPGQISGQISQTVYDSKTGAYKLLPQGAKVIGEYDSKIVYGQERVLIVWTRIILPNGKSINLEGMPGVDMSGYAGLSDQVNNHYGKIVTGVVFGSLIGAGAQMANGYNRYGNPSFDQLAIAGAAQNINEAGQQITQKNLNIQPTLEIRPGFRFNIFVTKDIALEPYVDE